MMYDVIYIDPPEICYWDGKFRVDGADLFRFMTKVEVPTNIYEC